MNFNTYQLSAGTTAVYPNRLHLGGLTYVALGLSGEVGEVANKVKKLIRDAELEDTTPLEDIPKDKRDAIASEVSDCLWYISQLCTELGISFDDIANHNLEKLHQRKATNTLKGAGDNR